MWVIIGTLKALGGKCFGYSMQFYAEDNYTLMFWGSQNKNSFKFLNPSLDTWNTFDMQWTSSRISLTIFILNCQKDLTMHKIKAYPASIGVSVNLARKCCSDCSGLLFNQNRRPSTAYSLFGVSLHKPSLADLWPEFVIVCFHAFSTKQSLFSQ